MINIFSFTRRATRTQYNLYMLASASVYITTEVRPDEASYGYGYIIGNMMRTVGFNDAELITNTALIVLIGLSLAWIVSVFAMQTQRIRDIGASYWLMLCSSVPIANLCYSIWLMATSTDAKRVQPEPVAVAA